MHNIVHTQLADRNYWCGRISLRQLSDLSRLLMADDGEIDWEEVRGAFDRAGHGVACRTYLLAAERLFGQAAPAELQPDARARLAYWQVDLQSRSSWLTSVGAWCGYHRAIISELYADPNRRRKVLKRLLPAGYRDYVQYSRKYVGRVD